MNWSTIDESIQTKNNFVWIRTRDFRVIRTSQVYTMLYGKRRILEIDWSDERGMYYTRHAKWRKFKKTHEFIGEIYDKKNRYNPNPTRTLEEK